MLDETEYARWIRSSKEAIGSARGDLEREEYNWACFKAQQAAEFAVKAVLRGLGLPAYGHSISALLARAPNDLQVNEATVEKAKTLDKYYVPTRYPNAWAEGTPMDYYTRSDAKKAIKCAEAIINWAESLWRSLKKERS
jgi:HEPN domain-containing protein